MLRKSSVVAGRPLRSVRVPPEYDGCGVDAREEDADDARDATVNVNGAEGAMLKECVLL